MYSIAALPYIYQLFKFGVFCFLAFPTFKYFLVLPNFQFILTSKCMLVKDLPKQTFLKLKTNYYNCDTIFYFNTS